MNVFVTLEETYNLKIDCTPPSFASDCPYGIGSCIYPCDSEWDWSCRLQGVTLPASSEVRPKLY